MHCPDIEDKRLMKLDKNFLFQFIDECRDVGVPLISFSGGEPLMCEYTEAVARYAGRNNIMTNLNTNGTLITKERAKKIAFSFNQVRISLNGTEKIHDKICGVKGCFNRTVNGIKYINSHKKRKCKLGVNIVIREDNIDCFKDLIDILKGKVDFVSLLPEFSLNQKGKIDGYYSKKIMDINRQLNRIGLAGSSKDLLTQKQSKTDCLAGKLFISLYWDKKLYACPFIFEKHNMIADLSKTSLKKAVQISKNPTDYCRGCQATCSVEISKVFNLKIRELILNFPNLYKKFL